MTAEDLQKKIDEFIGLTSTLMLSPARWSGKLIYTSPNGLVLFTLDIFNHENQWEYGGRSGCLPDHTSFSFINKG